MKTFINYKDWLLKKEEGRACGVLSLSFIERIVIWEFDLNCVMELSIGHG